MKKLFTFFLFSCFAFGAFAQGGVILPSLHGFRVVTLAGDTISMSQYYGKKLMIVNCASYCAYTPQYRALQNMYLQYNQNNFEILGFPSDDFGAQGGTDSAIAATCHGYNVTFQIMEKVACVSVDTAPIYKWLQKKDSNGVENSTVSWNFNKYLIDEAGHYVRHYDSPTEPDDTSIVNWILSASVIHDTTHTGVASIASDNLLQVQSANPTNTSIDLAVNLPASQLLKVELYAINGQLVDHLFDGITQTQHISYSVADVPSGIYFIKAQTNTGQQVIKYMVQH